MECPRQAFMIDLAVEIESWEKEGDQIILLGDMKECIQVKKVRLFLMKIGLRELILKKHGKQGPLTTRENTKNQAIDGLWGSPGLYIKNGGYLPVHQAIKTDHRIIWAKFQTSVALGSKQTPSKTQTARKIRLHHPSGQHKYISKLRHITWENNILDILRQLGERKMINPMTDDIGEYERIYKIIVSSRLKAEKAVRKLHMSRVQSPRMIKLVQLRLILIIILIKIKYRTIRIKQKTLARMSYIIGQHWWFTLNISSLLHQKEITKSSYIQFKRKSGTLRAKYLEDRAKQTAEKVNKKEETILYNIITV